MKKTFSLILIVILCLSFLACAASPALTDPTTQTTTENIVPPSSSTPAPKVSFPLEEEFTIHINHTISGPEGVDMQKALEANPLYQELYRKTNVKVQLNYYDPYNNMLAPVLNSGIVIGNEEYDVEDWVINKLILPLDEYIDDPTLMPNLHQQVFAELPELRGTMTELNGHIYALTGYDSDPLPNIENYLWINKAWLDRANLQIPTTFEALEAALTYFANNDMNLNGSTEDEIPFYPGTKKTMYLEGLLGMWGIPTTYIGNDIRRVTKLMYVENGQVQYINDQQFQQFITAMKRWFDNGILCKGIEDMTNFDREPVLSDTIEGDVQVGLFLAPHLKGIRGSEEYICITPPAADGNNVRWYQKPNVMGTSGKLCLMKDCEQPEIILAWLDLFYDPDITLRFISETATDSNELTLQDILPHFPYAKNAKFYETYPRTDEEKAMLANWELYKDVVTPEPLPNLKFDYDDSDKLREFSADIAAKFGFTLYNSVTYNETLESNWESYQKNLKQVRIQDYVSIVQKSYDAWLSEKAG